MSKLIFYFFLFYIISQVHTELTEEKRKELLSKFTKKISMENFKNSELSDFIVDYDPKKIEDLMKQFSFEEEYNFLEDINATIRVKDQASCGCCWSHSATTALAYRYQKLGLDIDLSPQDGLSCYLKDCITGNYLIDSQLNLVKNGTVTEECLPFSSADGKTIEKCPSVCKDGSPLKKYYSQNAYTTQDYYTPDTFYDIILIIMDQLVTKGPVVTGINVYKDFYDLHSDPERCHNEVYTYDGKSEDYGGHAITIVGYGKLNEKYYWLAQNSWGENSCDKGFVKIEFGQIGVESVAFSDPYMPEEGKEPIEIPVSFNSIDNECYLKVTTSSDYNNWKNSLDVKFENENKSKEFNFQCSTTPIPGRSKELRCFYDWQNYFTYKGNYIFKEANSLGKENSFALDDSFKGKKFTYWAIDFIEPYYTNSQYFFISEEGSRILFSFSPIGISKDILSPIYPNYNVNTPLSDCHIVQINLNGENLEWVYCNIKKDEIDYFDDFSEQSDSPLLYNIFCGYKEITGTIANKLDKSKFPVFKIKSLILPKEKQLTESTEINIISSMEGSITHFKAEDEMFIIFSNIEKNGVNKTYELLCIVLPSEVTKNYTMSCFFNIERSISLEFDNIYLLPYYFPYTPNYPYEIYINKTIKGTNGYEPEPEPGPEPGPGPEPDPQPKPSSSYFLKISQYIFVAILFLF